MANIARLAVQLSASTGRFKADMRGAQRPVLAFANTVSMARTRVMAWGGALTGLVAGGSLAYLTKQQIEYMGTLNDTAKRLNISTEALSSWEARAKLAGVSEEKLKTSLDRFTKAMGEASTGIGEGVEAFDALGISVKEIKQSTPEQLFRRVAASIADLKSQADKSAVTLNLFGRGGANMINFFDEVGKKLPEVEKEMQRLGIAVREIDAERVDELGDAFEMLKTQFLGLINQGLGKLAPAITESIDSLREWALTGIDVAELIDKSLEQLIKTSSILRDLFDGFQVVWHAIAGTVLTALGGIRTIFDTIAQEMWKIDQGMAKRFPNEHGGAYKKLADRPAPIPQSSQLYVEAAKQFDKMDNKLAEIGLGKTPNKPADFFQGLRDKLDEPRKPLAPKAGQSTVDFDKLEKDTEAKKKLFDATRTPLEKFRDTVGDLNTLYKDGVIDQELFIRGIRKAAQEYDKASRKAREFKQAAFAGVGKAALMALNIADPMGGKRRNRNSTPVELNPVKRGKMSFMQPTSPGAAGSPQFDNFRGSFTDPYFDNFRGSRNDPQFTNFRGSMNDPNILDRGTMATGGFMPARMSEEVSNDRTMIELLREIARNTGIQKNKPAVAV